MTNRIAPPSEVRGSPRERNKRLSGLPEVPDRDADSTDNISKEKSKMKTQNIGKTMRDPSEVILLQNKLLNSILPSNY